ncbi:RidA family protein [Bradyrhizobium sp. AUGA SZCCT0177]|uniref:RidA family protein n=1 Tax=Bradyrhizobium sp. AUGA SZCCT0177 TaxID=2807665 RepID=UPI0032DFD187
MRILTWNRKSNPAVQKKWFVLDEPAGARGPLRKKENRMQIRRINSEAALVPTTGYSQALEVAGHTRMLFVSGQIPVGADGAVPEGFEAQCRLAWSNVEAQLKAADMTLDNLVMHRTYLADRRYTMLNRAVRSEVLGSRETALTVVIAGIFDEAWLLEIEAVAAG